MAELTVDLTYGNALFMAAKELNKTGLIREDSAELLSILKQEPDLQAFLNTPAIAAREKKAVILKIFDGKICDELLNLLCILIDKGRTRHFSRIINTYENLMRKEEGVSYGEILSVKPLGEPRLQQFEAEVGKLLDVKVKLANKLDPGLIGGIKIYVDGKVIDASVKSRLKDLHGIIRQ